MGFLSLQLVGGTVGLAFALPEAIDSWTQMIKNNHVTKASQSLRDTANAIRRMTKSLMEQLDQIRYDVLRIEKQLLGFLWCGSDKTV